MKTGDTGELKERIIETLKVHGAKNYRRRELFGMLRMKGLDYDVFKDALAELEESGKDDAAPGAGLIAGESDRHVLEGGAGNAGKA